MERTKVASEAKESGEVNEVPKEQKVVEGPVKILYKKVGQGSLRLPGRIIPPGARFRAFPHEIPAAFKDLVIPIEVDVEAPARKISEQEIKKPRYSIVPRGQSKSLFNIVDQDGKVINEKGLKKEEAELFIKDLTE